MLHRLSLRVLPHLNALVTDQAVRKRKRLVMLAPGFVAFLCYRLLKLSYPLSDPWDTSVDQRIFFLFDRLMGLSNGTTDPCDTHLARRLVPDDWHGLSDGSVLPYGIQLSLLVLALLKVFVGYDFFAPS